MKHPIIRIENVSPQDHFSPNQPLILCKVLPHYTKLYANKSCALWQVKRYFRGVAKSQNLKKHYFEKTVYRIIYRK